MVLGVAAAAPPLNGHAIDSLGDPINLKERCALFNPKVFSFASASGNRAQMFHCPMDSHSKTLLIKLIEFVWWIVFLG